jgi:hypothetical protein
VTNYCDWNAVSLETRERYRHRADALRPFSWPVIPAAMLERSLANLERIATLRR